MIVEIRRCTMQTTMEQFQNVLVRRLIWKLRICIYGRHWRVIYYEHKNRGGYAGRSAGGSQ